MTGQRIGMLSLKLDALYCLVVGASLAIAGRTIGQAVEVPAQMIMGVGIAVICWAGAVVWMSVRLPLRTALRTVMIANAIATVLVASVSVLAASALVALVIVTVAIDVGLFAGSQAFALRSLRTTA